MIASYTARFIRIPSGYMGQIVEWPEVVTEGKDLEDCRESLQDALNQMIAAYKKSDWEIPLGTDVLSAMTAEV